MGFRSLSGYKLPVDVKAELRVAPAAFLSVSSPRQERNLEYKHDPTNSAVGGFSTVNIYADYVSNNRDMSPFRDYRRRTILGSGLS